MRQLKSLGSAVSALLWSGVYGLTVVYLTVFAPFVMIILFLNDSGALFGVPQNTALMLAMLLFFFLPLVGVIWGWTHTLLQEKADLCLGALLGIACPTLALIFLRIPENMIYRSDLPNPSVFLLTSLIVTLFVIGWVLMTWLWFTRGKKFVVQTSLQTFVASTTLGQSSRGVRLLTVAILAQLLVLSASWLVYRPMFH